MSAQPADFRTFPPAHKAVLAEELFERLREKHIYVRYFRQERIQNYLRITVGTDAQMEHFFEVLTTLVP